MSSLHIRMDPAWHEKVMAKARKQKEKEKVAKNVEKKKKEQAKNNQGALKKVEKRENAARKKPLLLCGQKKLPSYYS